MTTHLKARAGRKEPWGCTELLWDPSKVCVTANGRVWKEAVRLCRC